MSNCQKGAIGRKPTSKRDGAGPYLALEKGNTPRSPF